MRKQATQALIVATLALCAGGGCSQIQTVFHRPGDGAPARTPQVSNRSVTVVDEERNNLGVQTGSSRSSKLKLARVASYQPPELRTAPVQSKPRIAPQGQPIENNPAPSNSSVLAKNMNTNGAQRTDGANKTDQLDPRTADSGQRRYTAPGAAIRGLGQITSSAAAFALGAADNKTAASLSQSLVTNAQGTQGAAGLTAGSPSVGGVTTGNPGIQSGLLTGLAFANPNSNLFTPQVNRASGINGGRCTLVRAGLLEGNQACHSPKHRQR
ncbi:MAG: hypothetical protein DHS20C16_22180 [Phycisphaerae bacterium]|nr:MAG: hypothetical protein DHS20C16_22180 [Phycisphaerae bacterium]